MFKTSSIAASAMLLVSLGFGASAGAQSAPGGSQGGAGQFIFNGYAYTCTTRCIITVTPSGRFEIVDCCGGSVSMIIPPPPAEPREQ